MAYFSDEKKAILRAFRKLADECIAQMVESPVEINENMIVIRKWKPDLYTTDDVRMYENIPYKCIQTHDSINNETWNPTVASLWMQYHGTTPETARAWITPTGSHDIYKLGEWIIWTDDRKYECIQNTNFSPADYPNAWKVEE